MVSFKDEIMPAAEPKPDIVCPNCLSRVPAYSVTFEGPDRYGRTVRNYFTWCAKCDRGFEVVQFLADGNWHIHTYRYWLAVGVDKPVPQAGWTVVNQMPEPAPIVIGPGGDYDRQFTLTPSARKKVRKIQRMARLAL